MKKWSIAAANLTIALGLLSVTFGQSLPGQESEVRQAMLQTYLHGVDDALALQVLGPAAIPHLKVLLADPEFPRRDNVVAFLAHLDSGESTSDLVSFLMSPPADVTIPEEDRALLLAPQALGRIAARGDRAALETLLEMTGHGSDGGALASAASKGKDSEALRADLTERALRGLALSGAPSARDRLEGIASGRVRPQAQASRDLSRAAGQSLKLFDELRMPAGLPSSFIQAPTGATAGAIAILGSAAASGGGPSTQVKDTQSREHDGGLTYANHPDVPSLMTNARLETVLKEANLRAGRGDFTGDVACCITISRASEPLVFGFVGDGLDSIDDNDELSAVLNDPAARGKVVRDINWCGGPGTNIIGCAYVGGFGMALVRLSNLGTEAVLWIHEYGHNVGLSHSGDSRAIMFGTATGGNVGLAQTECNRYHSPLAGAGQTVVDTGACTDVEPDEVQDGFDNCPFIYNFSQADADGDGQGDACENDSDNDGVEDPFDCAPLNPHVWAIPGEVRDLVLTQTMSGTRLDWLRPAVLGGTPTVEVYDTLQSASPSNFSTGITCVESNDGNLTAMSGGTGPAVWFGEGNQPFARFGASVAAAGDVNGDLFDDIIIGVPSFSNGQDQEGRAIVYAGSVSFSLSPLWSVESDLDALQLGDAVSGAGDVNGDGFDDVMVAVPAFDNGSGAVGKVLVYHGSAFGPSPTESWSVEGDQPGGAFGASVAPAGDVNDDGYDDVIIGAPFYANGESGEGLAMLYLGSANGLASSASWSAEGGQMDARFGQSLASAGDVNNDGYSDVVVGAPMHDNGQTDEGKALLYLGSALGLQGSPAWVAESDQADAQLGSSVGGAGDVNGDGYSDLIVGAPLYDNGQTDEGRAFVYLGSAGGPGSTASWTGEMDQASASFGVSVAGAGDVDGDGLSDIIVGASLFDNGQTNEGRAFVFPGAPYGVSSQAVSSPESDQAAAQLGATVTSAGDVNNDGRDEILVGASLYDGGMINEGRASVYRVSQAARPPLGSAYYYLVRAESACGAGPLHFRSDGTLVAGANCP